MKELPIHFEHLKAEQEIYKNWEESSAFVGLVDGGREAFCIVMPPPNVTGVLHLGHVLDMVPQDLYARWHRMHGHATVWVPGTDHAGIATQGVVKKHLAERGIDFKKLTREEFLRYVWEFKEKHGNLIAQQLRRLGCSCDWSRERFTMDKKLSLAVNTAFVKLYNKKLIYRGTRMVNWCCSCGTAIADDEIEYKKNTNSLWHIRYPFVDAAGKVINPNEGIIVATTRPETLLGDSAVAVNPDDERYKFVIGKRLLLPLTGKTIPIIADSFVDIEFGTGAVKITPGHDFNDYSVGERQNLEIITVIDEKGFICEPAPKKYVGLSREEARKRIVQDLSDERFLVETEKYSNNLSCCCRCKNALEPRVSQQWFLKLPELSVKAKEAVDAGKINIIPQTERNDFEHWIANLHDWCISRQLWWGHRIPVFTCEECAHEFSVLEVPKCCPKCQSEKLTQDKDVLDTWFSSALWPFSVLGWPEQTPDLKFWFPNNVLFSGRDIMFFWDTKMMAMALELTGEIPFRDLVLHGMVTDEHGRKLSKSMGNNIEPMDIFEEYGTDAVRAGICDIYPLGRQDCKIGTQNFKKGQALVTKLWNSSRLLLSNIPKNFSVETKELRELKEEFKTCLKTPPNITKKSTLIEKWIISRLHAVVIAHDIALKEYNVQRAFGTINAFFWGDFCDWYLEIIKPQLRGSDEERAQVLRVAIYCMGAILKLFHPYTPFVTETLWQYFCEATNSDEKPIQLILESWIDADELTTEYDVELMIGSIMGLIREIREARQIFDIAPKDKVSLRLSLFEKEKIKLYEQLSNIFETCAVSEPIFVETKKEEKPRVAETLEKSKSAEFLPLSFADGFCYFKIPDGADIDLVRGSIAKKLAEVEKLLEKSEASLKNKDYVFKAPTHIVEETKNNVILYKKTVEKLKNYLAVL
jgi:valyl-tRNA synthetase